MIFITTLHVLTFAKQQRTITLSFKWE